MFISNPFVLMNFDKGTISYYSSLHTNTGLVLQVHYLEPKWRNITIVLCLTSRFGNLSRKIIFEFSWVHVGFLKSFSPFVTQIITALIFFAITKTITKIAGKWDCWVCQILKFASKRQNSLILKVKKWIQRSDSIQIWSRPA